MQVVQTRHEDRPVAPESVTSNRDFRHTLEGSLERVVRWVQANRYLGYEPADGNSSVLFPLTGGRVLPMRVLQQVVLRAPFNIRPFIGVARHESAIGRGYMAWGYLRMFRRSGIDIFLHEATTCLDWLEANRSAGYAEFCWGDPYEYATRAGRRPRGEPILVWTAFIGRAFLEAYRVTRDKARLRVAESIGRWVLALPRKQSEDGNCLSYAAYRPSFVHNANAVGAAFLAELAGVNNDEEALAVARSGLHYTCARQRPDGSWFYAEDSRYHWIDSFHTGYVLWALKSYGSSSRDTSFDDCLARGRRFYRDHFFEPNGLPKYFHGETYPIDIQCAAQAIETLALLAADESSCLDLATKVALWTIHNMQGDDGHFFYRDLAWTKVTTPMLHWGQATMVTALNGLLERLAATHD